MDQFLRRDGNDEDLKNLEISFKINRNCKFRDLRSPEKYFLLQLLSNDKNLANFFQLAETVPSVFILCILSHGGKGGQIFTDIWDEEQKDYQYFTTTEVINSVKQLRNYKNCLKMLLFGPCRGDIDDSAHTVEQSLEKEYSCCINFHPNEDNFILVYSTVETTSANRNKQGTWLVKKICEEMDNLQKDEVLPVFLTRIQHNIHRQSTFDSKEVCGQTPEIKLYPHRTFYVQKSPCNMRKEKTDFYYQWQTDSGENLRSRKAIIFYQNFTELVKNFSAALSNNLDFETSIRSNSVANLESYYKFVEDKQQREVGCILTCFFAKISEVALGNAREICVNVGGGRIPLREIIHRSIGPKNSNWIGKPKIFFFVNQLAESDAKAQHKFVVLATNHSGWLSLILPYEESASELLEILQGTKLKSGSNLQQLLSELLNNQISQPRENSPLLVSTLQYLLDFPDWPRNFVKPNFEESKALCTFDELMHNFNPYGDYKVQLIVAPAGNGKTTVMREVAHNMQKIFTELKILLLNFVNLYGFLYQMSRKNYSLTELILSYPGNSLSKEEVDDFVENKRGLLFIDGFDEICPDLRTEALNAVQKIAGKHIHLWISTRPEEEKVIVDGLKLTKVQTRVLEIKPFSQEQQLELLEMVTHKSEQECIEMLESFKKDVLQNPLHLTMISECGKALNLYEIYDKVILSKVRKALIEREGHLEDGRLTAKVERRLQLLQNLCSMYLIGGRFRDYDEIGAAEINSTGIATVVELPRFDGSGKQGRLQFIHLSFAEFLATRALFTFLKITDLKVIERSNDLINKKLREHYGVYVHNELHQSRVFAEIFACTDGFHDTELERKLHTYLQNLFSWVVPKKRALATFAGEGLRHVFVAMENRYTFNVLEKDSKIFIEQSNLLLGAACWKSEEISLKLLKMGALNNLINKSDALSAILEDVVQQNFLLLYDQLRKLVPELLEEILKRKSLDLCFEAAKKGHFQMLTWLLDGGVDINKKKGYWEQSALHVACFRSDIDIVRLLLERKADVDIGNKYDQKPLHYAAREGHLEVVKILLNNGATVEAKSAKGVTAIHLAAWKGHLMVLKFLLKKCDKSFIRVCDSQGFNVLHYAALGGNLPVAEFLIAEDKFLIRGRTNNEETTLHMAARGPSPELCQLLVRSGASVLAVDKNGFNAIHHACSNSSLKNLSVLEYLISLGDLNIESRTVNGRSALHLATEEPQYFLKDVYKNEMMNRARIKMVKMLIERGANILATDGQGCNALHFATQACSSKLTYEVIEFLIKKDKRLVTEARVPFNVDLYCHALLRSESGFYDDEIIKFDPDISNKKCSIMGQAEFSDFESILFA
ncbi:uncharacterized protein LOC132197766 isoform X2 [Neocloeon triangulifer]|nr:uncharacterized protein LOC132197766 isoform X2 [Neocloeon triangulifer]XP_059477281.1 uncharacterized protein LOC132197766 isoform X2 [Neocloeon triangulifer]